MVVINHALEWVTKHWEAASCVLFLLVSALNAVSSHYSEKKPGAARVMLRIAEMLSILRSKGAPGNSLPGWLSRLKAPVQSVPPDAKVAFIPPPSGAAAIVSLCALALAACPHFTVTQSLEKVHQAATGVSAVTEPGFHLACGRLAQNCIDAGVRSADKCEKYQTCAKARRATNLAVKLVHLAVVEGMQLAAIGNADGAASKLEIAQKALADAYRLMRENGIMDGLRGLAESESSAAPTTPASLPAEKEVK